MRKIMKTITLWIAAHTAAAGLLLVESPPSAAQASRPEVETIVHDYLAAHPQEVEDIVRNYLVKNPEVLRDALVELVKRRAPASAAASASPNDETAPERSAAVRSNASLLFDSPHQVTLGNPNGDVAIVEFFDYNCGFCKRALPDMMTLIQDDPNLKVVLKEFPILGPGSAESARVGIAVRMQDSDGKKYLAFHEKLLGGRGPAGSDAALAIAREEGLDMARLEKDMASDEVSATIEEDARLARAIGINGTPAYVVADSVISGAVGAGALKLRLESARSHARSGN
jgi:protein-disulfide isomerase